MTETNNTAAAIIRSLLDDCAEQQGEETPTEYQKDIIHRFNFNMGDNIETWEQFVDRAERTIAELVPDDLFLRRIDW